MVLQLSLITIFLTASNPVDSYNGTPLEPIRQFLGRSKTCEAALSALQFVSTHTPDVRLINKPDGSISIDASDVSRFRTFLVELVKSVQSPRLSRELSLAIWRSYLSEAEAHARINEEVFAWRRSPKSGLPAWVGGRPLQRLAQEWADTIRTREREVMEATLHALSIQAQIDPENRLDPVFSLKHATPQERMWVWRFDRKRDDSSRYFAEKARSLLAPIVSTERPSPEMQLPIGPLATQVLKWVDSLPITPMRRWSLSASPPCKTLWRAKSLLTGPPLSK